jgi:hypothetical protein
VSLKKLGKNDLMMKKFWRLIQILLIGDFDVSLQGGRFGD